MYKCVIFDLDGTLLDSLYDLGDSVNRALQKFNLPIHPYESYKHFVGNGRTKLIERAMGKYADDKKLFEMVTAEYDKNYLAHCLDKSKPYEGIVPMLNYLNSSDIKICVLSNKPDEFVKKIIDTLFSNISFDIEWGKKNDYPPKPEPDSLLAILKELLINKSDCLYVGDSDVDIVTARNAQVDCCGVLWGFRTRKELEYAGAEKIVETTDELLKVIMDG